MKVILVLLCVDLVLKIRAVLVLQLDYFLKSLNLVLYHCCGISLSVHVMAQLGKMGRAYCRGNT